MKFQK